MLGAPPSGCEGGSWGCRVPAGLKRYYGQGDLHFITFSCYKRLPLLASPQSRDLFVQELGRARTQYGFKLVGYIVMPEHVHLLVGEAPENKSSVALQMLKQRVSLKLRKERRNERRKERRKNAAAQTRPDHREED